MSMREQNTTQNDLTIHPVIERLLNKRGHEDLKAIQNFFSWDLNAIPKLTQMQDMDLASDRIIRAIDQKESIGIYGDYDVDGTTSCALFYHFFQMLGIEVKLFQPSRFVEGYGVHKSSIDHALATGVKLLITVDCGITNTDTADYTHNKDIDLIITDHHKDAAEYIPRAFAVVNPNRRDEPEDSELRTLAGVGVAFAICVNVREKLMARGQKVASLYPLLQFVAIGTICDLAKLGPLNMRLTRHGLKQIPQTNYPGIRVFFSPEEREVEMMASADIAFLVGPMINSKGRLDHPEAALKLLTAKDHKEAFEYYSQLEISNRERKIIQKEVFDQAKKMVINELKESDHPISIVYSPNWHEGVIGIVASKLVETFEVPAIVFTDSEEEGIIKASARSAGELNIFHCLNECKELFLKFGGHKAAAGLSMPKENFEIFKNKMKGLISSYPEMERRVQDFYDIGINFSEIDKKLMKELELLEPFGMGNSRPVFRMNAIRLDSYQILKDIHVKWSFTSKANPKIKLSGISFNYIGKWNTLHPEDIFARQDREDITAQFSLSINRFRGNEIIQLMVDKVFLGNF